MDLRLLRTFITAARLGSFTQAAERLYLAQPTVTQHIRLLEEQLGYRLFERSRRRVTLTPAGRRFLPHAVQALAAIDSGIEDLTAWSQGYTRQLNLASSPLIATSVLPALLRRYTALYPEVEVRVLIRGSPEIGRTVAAGEADLGLARMPPAERDLLAAPIYSDQVLLVAPHDGGDWDSAPPDFEAVLARHLLFTHNHPVYWDDLLLALRQRGLPLRTMAVSEVNVTRRFIEEGLGVSFLPHSTVWRELAEGRIMEVPAPTLELPTAHTYLVWRREARPEGPARALVDLLAERFGAPGLDGT